jgi:hypothetical protein
LPDKALAFSSHCTQYLLRRIDDLLVENGRLGVRLLSILDEHKCELQVRLSQKLEKTLPELVAGQFQKPELLL